MRVLICAVVLLVASDALAGGQHKIRDDRRQFIGDFYDPATVAEFRSGTAGGASLDTSKGMAT